MATPARVSNLDTGCSIELKGEGDEGGKEKETGESYGY